MARIMSFYATIFLLHFLLTTNFVALAQPVLDVKCAAQDSFCNDGAKVVISTDIVSTPPEVTKPITLNTDYGILCTVTKVVQSQSPISFECTLSAQNLPEGEYSISLPGDQLSPLGYLRVGRFIDSTIKPWTAPTEMLPSPKYMVGAVNNTWPSTGDKITIYGNFIPSQKQYNVIIYNTETSPGDLIGQSAGLPTCTVTDVLSKKLTCVINAEVNMMGMYKFLVIDTQSKRFLQGSTVQPLLAVNPPLPVVTSAAGDCATQSAKCITGATLTLTGSNFNTRAPSYNYVLIGRTQTLQDNILCTVTESTQNTLTCKLDILTPVRVGAYPIHVRTQVCAMGMKTPLAPAGYLMLHGKATDKGWITATKSLSLFIVDSVAPAVLRDGANLTINGNFDATQQYHVEFSQEALPYAADSSFKGECNVVSVTSTAIVCMYKSSGNTKDVRCPLVYDAGNAYYLTMNCTAQTRVELYPAVPNVQGASGDCAKSSTACRNGASLTISGTGFNPSSTAANRVTLVGLASSSCDVVEVSASSLTCQLKVRPEDAGVYQLQVQTKVSDDEWSTPVSAGSIVLNGGAGVPGWSSGTVPLPSAKNTTTNNTAALACSIVFGVLFLALAVALTVICCRYTFVRRGTRNAQEPFWSTTDASHATTLDSTNVIKANI